MISCEAPLKMAREAVYLQYMNWRAGVAIVCVQQIVISSCLYERNKHYSFQKK